MLVDAGIHWTLTGHSERRVGFGFPVRASFSVYFVCLHSTPSQGEPSSVVGIKTKNAIDCGMSAIFCLGESVIAFLNAYMNKCCQQLAEREKGVTMKVCADQLEGLKAALKAEDWNKIVLAYEPVWAIGM